MNVRTVRVAVTLMAALICAMMASAAGAQKCSRETRGNSWAKLFEFRARSRPAARD